MTHLKDPALHFCNVHKALGTGQVECNRLLNQQVQTLRQQGTTYVFVRNGWNRDNASIGIRCELIEGSEIADAKFSRNCRGALHVQIVDANQHCTGQIFQDPNMIATKYTCPGNGDTYYFLVTFQATSISSAL